MVVGFPRLRFWAVSVAAGHGNHGFPMVVLLGGFHRGRTWKPLGFSRLFLGGFHCGQTWKSPTHGRFFSRPTWKPRISSQLHWFSVTVIHGNPEFHRKLSAPTQRKARPQDGHPNATQGTSASWAPQCNARHVHKLGAPTYVRNTNARHVRNTRHIRTSTSWALQRNARIVRKMVAQTQNSSTMKTSTQGSTRLKDELEDGYEQILAWK